MDYILYEEPLEHIARIVLNRPEKRNAQDSQMIYELNDALDRAAHDDTIKVIIISANGPDFSAGNDLREEDPNGNMLNFKTVGTWTGFKDEGHAGMMAREKEIYLGMCERWRNIPKPTIAQVHGRCIAGGLLVVFPCDIVIASEGARFMDNTVSMGIPGSEYFTHPMELGSRKAKEFLFTAEEMSAEDAHKCGLVNHVVREDALSDYTLAMARKIAKQPLFALKLAKEAVNGAEDAAGRSASLNIGFALHQLAHSHCMQVYGMPIDPSQVNPAALKGSKYSK